MMGQQYFDAKKAGYRERERKGLVIKPNGRSADFIIPSFAVGCELGCAYCYVARHRAYGNPVELMTNREVLWEAILAHYRALPPKMPTQTDPSRWVYDIGESTDCLTPKIVETTRWFIGKFLQETHAKPSFATKVPKPERLDEIHGSAIHQARVRVSLMPQHLADQVERGTGRMDARIESIDGFLSRGYEVHVNFSPVIVYTGWVEDYRQLFRRIDSLISSQAKAQLKAEVIFLTHHEGLHEQNANWFPEAERLLWMPQWQENKTTLQGDSSVYRYKSQQIKPALIAAFRNLMAAELPYCDIRYIF